MKIKLQLKWLWKNASKIKKKFFVRFFRGNTELMNGSATLNECIDILKLSIIRFYTFYGRVDAFMKTCLV